MLQNHPLVTRVEGLSWQLKTHNYEMQTGNF